MGGLTEKRPSKAGNPHHVATAATLIFLPLGLILGYVLMEVPCYADFCIEHIQPMAKASSQIALGVFYGWVMLLGVVMFMSRRIPSLHRSLHTPIIRTHTLGSILLHLSIFLLLFFNFIFFYYRATALLDSPVYAKRKFVPARRAAFFTAMVTGKLTDVSLGIIMLLASKNSGFQTLLGVSFDKGVVIHRLVGWFLAAAVVLHTVLYVYWTSLYRLLEDLISVLFMGSSKSATHEHAPGWGEGNWMVTMGTLSTILFIFPYVTSIPYLRRNAFNLFYYTHFLVFPALILAWLHAASDFYYCIPGLGMYIVDVALRIGAGRKGGRVLSAVREGRFVRVDFEMNEAVAGCVSEGGMWAFVNVPGVAKLEWHPYSFAQAPNSTVATILFKPTDDAKQYENKLATYLLDKNQTDLESKNIKINIDGPFGALAFNPQHQDRVICFVAGTGLSPGVSVIRHYLSSRVDANQSQGERGAMLVWSVRESDGEDVSLIKELTTEGANVEIITTTPLNNAAQNEPTGPARMDPLAILNAQIPPSQLKLKLGIFICGGERFTKAVHQDVVRWSQGRKGDVEVLVHVEGFCL